MTNKMLIDASHQEETRVVVVKGSRIEEFDFESEHKKQLKGNIYLAKVTRVEPSLQAAFVEYGGNRHGFLAFSEIHPDYYQIPVADRQALIEEELAHAARDEDEDEVERPAKPARGRGRRPRSDAKAADASEGESVSEPAEGDDASEVSSETDDAETGAIELTGEAGSEDEAEGSEDAEASENTEERASRGRRRGRGRRRSSDSRVETVEDEDGHDEEPEEVDQIGAEDAMEEVAVRQVRPRKQYKIQEVIKRRQIILVQVVKEERGNKGAALTTYLSLAGRYSVLMPNTARGGGISRKITSATDRKRLKELVRDLEVPKGMGIILRTAGANRTKPEIKRDYEYLMRLWETVRTLTLGSTAPALVYEEGSLIKRSIRDLYNKDIEQILVAGERGYREAKDFMRMLLPSQAKVVQPYRETSPIFTRAGIESQLDKMLQPNVTLKSGGYIIINQTEALVAIDVNSGRSTREHSIEDTAYQTNLEAAEEVARQLRLRDLAGLIVIDFIDMEEKRNNRAVEKKLKDCLKDDRARIQLGRISHFGLMEMSRQRIRASVLESTMQTCPVCNGNGFIRSASSLALHALRSIEEHLQKYGTHDITVRVPTATALYILNEKRQTIEDLERSHGLRITLAAEEGHGLQHVSIENGAEAVQRPKPAPVNAESVPIDLLEEEAADEAAAAIETEDETEAANVVDAAGTETEAEREEGRRRRRRRRGRRQNGTEGEARDDASAASDEEEGEAVAAGDEDAISGSDESADEADSEAGRERKRRRRGRRGGRRNREEDEMTIASDTPVMDVATGESAPRGRRDDAFETAAERSPDPEMTDAVTAFDADYASQAGSQESAHAALAPDENEILAASAEAGASTDEIRPLDEVFPYEDDAAAEVDENVLVEEQAAADQPDSATRAPREDDEAASGGADAQPKRTGWWSRRFG